MAASTSCTPPTTVTASWWLWVATGVCLAIMYLVDGLRPVDVAALPATQQPYAGVAAVSSTIAGIIAGALHILFAWFMFRGRYWARFVLTVIGALSLIGLTNNLAGGDLLSGFILVLTIAAGVLMYLRPSNEYIRRRR